MTPSQYRKAIAALKLSQVRAGEFMGYSGRASQGWALGEKPVPRVVELVLRLMIRCNVKPEDMEKPWP